VKRLHSKDRESYNREVEILKNLEGNHPHLITLLATYKQAGTYYLLFPWAQADLFRYWKTENPSPALDEYVYWVADQCTGLAQGLRHIQGHHSWPKEHGQRLRPHEPGTPTATPSRRTEEHNFYGRHGDIKPENILWFHDPNDPDDFGNLKITDFGLAESRFHLHDIKGRATMTLGFTPTYRPPESDLGERFTASSDIWNLGCVYLEFISWLIGGNKLLQEFSYKRLSRDSLGMDTDSFFEVVMDEKRERMARVKPAVEKVRSQLSPDKVFKSILTRR
jgi:serine/threonine protein kinase